MSKILVFWIEPPFTYPLGVVFTSISPRTRMILNEVFANLTKIPISPPPL